MGRMKVTVQIDDRDKKSTYTTEIPPKHNPSRKRRRRDSGSESENETSPGQEIQNRKSPRSTIHGTSGSRVQNQENSRNQDAQRIQQLETEVRGLKKMRDEDKKIVDDLKQSFRQFQMSFDEDVKRAVTKVLNERNTLKPGINRRQSSETDKHSPVKSEPNRKSGPLSRVQNQNFNRIQNSLASNREDLQQRLAILPADEPDHHNPSTSTPRLLRNSNRETRISSDPIPSPAISPDHCIRPGSSLNIQEFPSSSRAVSMTSDRNRCWGSLELPDTPAPRAPSESSTPNPEWYRNSSRNSIRKPSESSQSESELRSKSPVDLNSSFNDDEREEESQNPAITSPPCCNDINENQESQQSSQASQSNENRQNTDSESEESSSSCKFDFLSGISYLII